MAQQLPLPKRWTVRINITEIGRTATVMASTKAEARRLVRQTLWECLTADAERYEVRVVGKVEAEE